MLNLNESENSTKITSIHSYVLSFEKAFSMANAKEWMKENWTTGYYFCAVYIFLIFSIRYYMQNKPRFDLRKFLAIWNITFAIFSIVGFCRTFPELYHIIIKYGFYHSVCDCCFPETEPTTGFWIWTFTLSKLLELGDTMFVVLRKQPLVFLHWYHHTTVLLYTWYSFKQCTSSARWFFIMNYGVHSFMYSYYALRALRCSLPKFVMMLITSMQILQMVVGCFVNYSAYVYLQKGQACEVSVFNIMLSVIMYFSYFVLFVYFFYKAYLGPSSRKKSSYIPEYEKVKSQ